MVRVLAMVLMRLQTPRGSLELSSFFVLGNISSWGGGQVSVANQ